MRIGELCDVDPASGGQRLLDVRRKTASRYRNQVVKSRTALQQLAAPLRSWYQAVDALDRDGSSGSIQ